MERFCISLLLISCLVLPSLVWADTVTDLLKSAQTYYEQKKYFKAAEDLEWAKKEINNLHFQQLKTYLPASVEGYTVSDSGGDVIGIKGLDRVYTQTSSGNTVKINIVSGSGATGTGGLGAFMNMANWASSMNATGSSLVVVKGRKGNQMVDAENQEVNIMFSLNNNVAVTISSDGFASPDEAKKFAELIDFDKLEKEFQ